jgi:hypothetical protein
LNLDGKAFRPDGKPAATLIPPAFGLAGVNLHTWGGGWGTISYWNAYVANLELNGRGNFLDALHFYQLALPVPKAKAGSFDATAAGRGQRTFTGKGRCSTCHVPPLFTEPGWNVHKPSEIGIDDFQANRSPDKSYRTAPLRAERELRDAEKRDLMEYLKSL